MIQFKIQLKKVRNIHSKQISIFQKSSPNHTFWPEVYPTCACRLGVLSLSSRKQWNGAGGEIDMIFSTVWATFPLSNLSQSLSNIEHHIFNRDFVKWFMKEFMKDEYSPILWHIRRRLCPSSERVSQPDSAPPWTLQKRAARPDHFVSYYRDKSYLFISLWKFIAPRFLPHPSQCSKRFGQLHPWYN